MTENGDIDLSFIDNLDEEFPETDFKKPQRAPPSELMEPKPKSILKKKQVVIREEQ